VLPSVRGPRDRLRSFYVAWLPVGLGLAALTNIVMVLFLPLNAIPLRLHQDGALTELVHTEGVSLDRRYGFYLELDDATDGGVLVVPAGSIIEPELAEGFAEFEVIDSDFEPNQVPDGLTDDPPLGTFETKGGEEYSYWIVSGDADTWWLGLSDSRMVVIPESVAPVPAEGS
jgi:hypothetical protein